MIPLVIPSVALAQSASDSSCLVCKFPLVPEVAKPGMGDICEDLFGAACLDSNGEPKFAKLSGEQTEELKRIIKEARDKTAKLMGFKSLDEAFKARFKEEGIELAESKDPSSDNNFDKNKRVFAGVEECRQEREEIQKVQYLNMTDLDKLKEYEKKIESFKEKYRERSIALHVKDLPNFYTNVVGLNCSTYKSNSSVYLPAGNPELATVCGKLTEVRRKAIDLFRLEGSPEYKGEAEKFVREHFVPEPQAVYGGFLSTPVTPYEDNSAEGSQVPEMPELTEEDEIKFRIGNGFYSLGDICSQYSRAVENIADKVENDFLIEINRNKTTVDGLLNAFYNEKNKSRIDRIFEELKGDLQEISKQLVKEPNKRAQILDEYDRLKLTWFEKPPVSAYKKNERDVHLLNEETEDSHNKKLASIFSDPSLSYFTTVNAYYAPTMSTGVMKTDERVELLPAFINRRNAFDFVSTLAHELGHKLGPDISKMNGYDISDRYKDLLACYSDSKSIKMQKKQADEVVADAISAEILAYQLSKLPFDERRRALMASMETFCYDDFLRAGIHKISCKDQHPEPSLRVSGIFGANPNLRKAIGCEGESPKYKSCGLNISLSSEGTKKTEPGSPVRSAQ